MAQRCQEWLSSDHPISLERGHEYAAYIINALRGGEVFGFNGNVANTKLIYQFTRRRMCGSAGVCGQRWPACGACGRLPPQLVALNHTNVMVEEMAVEAALTGDPNLVYWSCAYDPLASAVLSLAEIKKMVNEMLKKNQPHLPQFRHFTV